MNSRYKNQCQSCGMKLGERTADILGTEADGALSAEFCKHCYQNGSFTQDFTIEEMIESATKRAIEAGAPRILAPLIRKGIPKLKRWRQNY
ncbi:MAG: zinc ribbon domain-containing protein [Turicibacter sp.]|nr:zinc ribbon domain-containing protein [Turicibacter sp.]